MSPTRRASLSARIGLSALTLVLTLLWAEGTLSLLAGRSLLGASFRAAPSGPSVHLGSDAERLAAGRVAEGELRGHVDPLVGIMMAAGDEHRTFRAEASIRPDGVRSRPTPRPVRIAQHIVILGDSVAFGYGVGDDQTLANQLEQTLARIRGPEALPVVASTVAVPGWNHRNAVHFLIDHLQHLAPDIVVFLPVANDLTDTFGVTEAGHRALLPDPAEADPWLSVHDEPRLAFIMRAMAAAQGRSDAFDLAAGAAGPQVLLADLSPESQRRYDDAAASMVLLARILGRAGVPLLMAYAEEDSYGWTLRARLLKAASGIPSMALYTRIPKAYRLVGDPHPDPEGIAAMARWVAEELLARGWVEGAGNHPLPPLPELALSARASEPTPGEVLDRARELSQVARDELQARIDLHSGRGVNQIYGGLNQDGTMSSAFAAVLAPGPRVEVLLAPLRELPQLYPLRVEVSLDGVTVGELLVPPAGAQAQVFARPPGTALGEPVEVKLSPELWGVNLAYGRSQIASCRVLSLDTSR